MLNNKFRIFEVDQRLIDYLRGDGEFANRPSKEIDKQVFVSFYYHSKSIKDIAKEQSVSEFNVKQRLYRIRNKIRKEVNKNG